MRAVTMCHRQRCLILLALFFFLAGVPQIAAAETSSCPENLHSPIVNFCEVSPGILWRGAKPDEAGAAWLIDHGVGSIVNLELLHDDLETLSRAVPASAGQAKVDYYRIRDWEPNVLINQELLDDHVAQFLAIVDQAPKPIYVHCRSGENRTGVMVAAYRIFRQGQGDDAAVIDKAITEMKGYHGFWSDSDAAYLRGLTGEHLQKILQKAAALKKNLAPDAQLVCDKDGCRILNDDSN